LFCARHGGTLPPPLLRRLLCCRRRLLPASHTWEAVLGPVCPQLSFSWDYWCTTVTQACHFAEVVVGICVHALHVVRIHTGFAVCMLIHGLPAEACKAHRLAFFRNKHPFHQHLISDAAALRGQIRHTPIIQLFPSQPFLATKRHKVCQYESAVGLHS
jgi:hypothetical protein